MERRNKLDKMDNDFLYRHMESNALKYFNSLETSFYCSFFYSVILFFI